MATAFVPPRAAVIAPAQRADYAVIARMIEPGAKVLDLGCGDGDLLMLLRDERQVQGRGLEISEEGIKACIAKGLTVAHTNIDDGLADYADKSFDYVILNQTLQAVLRPRVVLAEMLRVGKRGIVSFPNFAYWRVRMQFFFRGRMPVLDCLPYAWYDTPNIHHVTINDFRRYCHEQRYRILREHHLNSLDTHWLRHVRVMPNLFARYGLFMLANLEQ